MGKDSRQIAAISAGEDRVTVEAANGSDAVEVMGIVTGCLRNLRSENIFQWDEVYPDVAVIVRDLLAESLYVLRLNGVCVAMVCLDEQQPEEYAGLPWRHISGRVLAMHRLCVHPAWQGRGYATRLLAFAKEHAVTNGYAAIRFDVFSGNRRALAFYERHGYQRVAGSLYFPRRELPFYCYEKEVGTCP